MSTDRGLCGGLNGNLFREVTKLDKNNTVTFITAGRKASQFIARTKRQLAAEFTYKDTPQFAEARAISKFAQDLFLKGEVDAVDILFTNYHFDLGAAAESRAVSADRENHGRHGGRERAGAGIARGANTGGHV